MVRALEEINLINANEGEDKSASDMWASLIASGAMLAGEGEGVNDKRNGTRIYGLRSCEVSKG
jgi:hypothetical protein